MGDGPGDKRVQETWLILEDCFFLVQEWSLSLLLSAYFLLVRSSFRNVGTQRKVWSKKDLPLVEKIQVREYLSKPDLHKWGLIGCIHEYWGSCQMFLRDHCLLSLNDSGDWERCLRTGGK